MATRLTHEQYHALASRRGVMWLGELPANSHTKTIWRCSNGHEFDTTYDNIRGGHGCRYCAGNMPLTEPDYHALASKHGLTWIGALPKSANHKTEWMCPQGHKFMTKYAVIYTKHGCPYCAGLAKKTVNDFLEIAKSRGFAWLGLIAVGAKTLTEWQCSKGHQFQATYQGLHRGNECPHCKPRVNGFPVSKPQLKIHAMIGGILNYRSKRAKGYCIDIALDADTLFPIAIEYDAQFWHSKNAEHDAKRDEWLLANGWSILHIKSVRVLPSADEIRAAINRLRRHETNYIEIVMPDCH